MRLRKFLVMNEDVLQLAALGSETCIVSRFPQYGLCRTTFNIFTTAFSITPCSLNIFVVKNWVFALKKFLFLLMNIILSKTSNIGLVT